ncbi:MAG: hypothetical protein AB1479_00370 [Pseudomonadota bacterium]
MSEAITDAEWMRHALAARAEAEGVAPVGAVLTAGAGDRRVCLSEPPH